MKKNLFCFLIVLAQVIAGQVFASGAGLTYQGRLVGPDGNPVTAQNVQFRLQIRTPGSENCLLYEELQSKDMSNSNGVFAISINDGSGVRQDTNSYTIEQIFANRGALTFPGGYCISGGNYSPNSTDGRKLQVYFNDGTFSGWEPAPSQAINFIPMAIESMQVGGYKKEQLVKVANGVDTTGNDLSAANFTELMALLNGTSTQFIKPSGATFTTAPQWAGTPSAANDLANKSYVDAQIAAGLPNFGTAGTYTKVTTDAKGRVSSGTTLSAADIPALDAAKITTGVLPIANGGTNSSTALAGSKVMVSNATSIIEGMASNTAKSNNTFVMRDGSGNIAAALGTFDGLSVVNGGALALNGATSGSVTVAAPTAPTTYTLTLPTSAGSTGQVLTTDGTGITSWAAATSGLPAAAGTAAAPGYAFSGNTNTGMFGAAANQIGFSTNGAERVRIDASGNVGIGNTSPSVKLDVAGAIQAVDSTAGVAIYASESRGAGGAYGVWSDVSGAATTNVGGKFTATGATNNYGIQIGNGTGSPSVGANNWALYSSSYAQSYFAGNVGIGTTSPLYNLDVTGQIRAYSTNVPAIVVHSESASVNSPLLMLMKGHGVSIKPLAGDGLGLISFGNYQGTTSASISSSATENHSGAGAIGGDLTFKTTPNGASAALSRMVIDNAGNVGIGTASPGALLDVNGTMRVNQICDSTGANCKTISGGWNATAGLSALTAATATDNIDNTNFAQTWNWSTANTQSPMTMTADSLTTGSLLSLTSSSASLNSSSGLLNVANTGASTSGTVARIQSNSTAGSGLTVLANGNVGIGTSSPSTQLQLTGTNPLIRLEVPSGNSASNGIYLSENGTARGGLYLYGSGYAAGQMSSVSSGDGGVFTVSNDSARGEYRFNIEGSETKRIRFRGSSSGYNAAEIKVTKAAGSNDNGTMILKTTGHAIDQLALDATGNVGVGNASPNEKLDTVGNIKASGQIYAGANLVATGATVDFNLGNTAILQSVGGAAITLNNMKDGASYVVIIQDTTVRTYTFTNCTNTRFSPANAATISGSETVYNIIKTTIAAATYCYISWSSGYQ